MSRSRLSHSTLLRLGAVLVLSLVIHLALIGALPSLPIWQQQKDEPIVASLEMPATPPAAIAVPTPIVPAQLLPLEPRPPKMKPLPIPADPSPAVVADSKPAPDTPVITSSDGPTTVAEGGGAAPASSSDLAPAAPAVAAPPARALPIPPAPPAKRPVDATLSYNVTAHDPKKPDQMLVGHGTLGFHADGNAYRATLEVQVALLFVSITALTGDSHGLVGADGLEPQQYSETQRGKGTSTTSLIRDADGTSQVSSSQGGGVAQAPPGVQDRLSVLLQVGALMQANPAFNTPGARFSIPVAGLKGNVELYNFAAQGVETVKLDSGAQKGLHVSRILRPGTNDRGIDVWVGTESPNLPLRVLYTEPGGSTIDMVLAQSGP
jgi:hypothetical protein